MDPVDLYEIVSLEFLHNNNSKMNFLYVYCLFATYIKGQIPMVKYVNPLSSLFMLTCCKHYSLP